MLPNGQITLSLGIMCCDCSRLLFHFEAVFFFVFDGACLLLSTNLCIGDFSNRTFKQQIDQIFSIDESTS